MSSRSDARSSRRLVGMLVGLAMLLPGLAAGVGDSPVADAVLDGDFDAVRDLLRRGADVNAALGDGTTALHWAAKRGEIELAEMLLYAGANLEAATRIGAFTPLHLATENGDAKMIAALLEAGADLGSTTSTGATALMLAAASGRAEAVETLLQHGAEVDTRESAFGQTALMFAAAANRVEAISALIEGGAETSLATEVHSAEEQEKALFAAFRRKGALAAAAAKVAQEEEEREGEGAARESEGQQEGQQEGQGQGEEAAEEQGAEEPEESEGEASESEGEEAQAAVAEAEGEAEESEEPAAAGKLPPPGFVPHEAPSDAAANELAGRDLQPTPGTPQQPEAEDTSPAEPQSVPSEKSEEGAVDEDYDPELSQPIPPEGQDEPTDEAATAKDKGDKKDQKRGPRPLSFGQLVGQQGGMTALHHAARQGHVESVVALLDGGADIDQPSGGDHTTPLLIATLNGHFDLARLLLERGADPTLKSSAGATPLYAALNVQWAPHSFYPQPSPAQEKTTHLELMEALLAAGADPNVRLEKKLWYTGYNFDQSGVDEAGATPFWRAAQAADVEAMRLLLSFGANPTVATKVVPERRLPNGRNADSDLDKNPPKLGSPAVSPFLAATGAGYNANFHRIHPAGFLRATEYLVEELGACVLDVDHHGYTAVHNAAARGDNEMIVYLVKKGADVTAISRAGETTADMANGPVQRIQPFPDTVALLETLGSKNNDNCVSC